MNYYFKNKKAKEIKAMKFVCSICGYVYEGEAAPAECPVCHAGADKFVAQSGEKTWLPNTLLVLHRCQRRHLS